MTNSSIKYHNPKNVPSAGEGWRFILVDELLHPPKSFLIETWQESPGFWRPCITLRSVLYWDESYRTNAPLPEPFIYEDEAYRRGVEEHVENGGLVMARLISGAHWTSPLRDGLPLIWDLYYYKIADEPKDLCVCGNPIPCEYEAKVDAYIASKSGIRLDWSKLPRDIVGVCISATGRLFGYEKTTPQRTILGWTMVEPWNVYDIPFTFSGDWKDSLTPRPEELAMDAFPILQLEHQPRKEGDAEMNWDPKVIPGLPDLTSDREASNPPAVGETIDIAQVIAAYELGRQSARDGETQEFINPFCPEKQYPYRCAFFFGQSKEPDKLQSEWDRLRQALENLTNHPSQDSFEAARKTLEEIKL